MVEVQWFSVGTENVSTLIAALAAGRTLVEHLVNVTRIAMRFTCDEFAQFRNEQIAHLLMICVQLHHHTFGCM